MQTNNTNTANEMFKGSKVWITYFYYV
jgi:hypothetical protein